MTSLSYLVFAVLILSCQAIISRNIIKKTFEISPQSEFYSVLSGDEIEQRLILYKAKNTLKKEKKGMELSKSFFEKFKKWFQLEKIPHHLHRNLVNIGMCNLENNRHSITSKNYK